MCYIPDPIEQMESRIDDLCFEWEQLQKGVPEGFYRCPECKQLFDYEPIAVSSRPDSPVCCYNCLSDDLKAAYDKFVESIKR